MTNSQTFLPALVKMKLQFLGRRRCRDITRLDHRSDIYTTMARAVHLTPGMLPRLGSWTEWLDVG